MKKSLTEDKSAQTVALHHKREADYATQLVDKALESIVLREHRHAVELLKSAIEHLESAEVIQRILKALPGESGQR